LYPQAFTARCAEHLPQWKSDVFLDHVITNAQDIDGWYALSFCGSELFDALLAIRQRMDGESDYWINAVALPGDAYHETRAVFILYHNQGDIITPEPPPSLRQDMRLLTVLALAWRQLEHQVRALVRLSEADRRDMINLIAPGLMHHEIGFNMRTAYGQAYEQFHLLKRISEETGREEIQLATRYAYGIAELVLKLYRITDAFNNLDKRGQVETSNLDEIFCNIKLLLQHRLGSNYTDLSWDSELFKAQTLETDVVLFTQTLINIINNAINALTDANTPQPRHIQVPLESARGNKISLRISNNGPAIPAHLASDIFKWGFTSRKQGHGQGLYLARLVSHYLGGDVTLLETATLDTGFNIGFRFSLNRHLPTTHGVAHATD
jgi:signal transduction histidine kinase